MGFRRLLRVTKNSDFLWVFSGQVLAFAGGILGIKVLTTILGPAGFGRFSLGLTVAGIVHLFVYGPVSQGILRLYSSSKEDGVLGAFYVSVIRAHVFALALLLVGSVVLFFVARWSDSGWQDIVVSAAAWAFTSGILVSVLGLANARRDRRFVTVVQGVDVLIRTSIAAVLLLIFDDEVYVAMWGYAIGTGLILLTIVLRGKLHLRGSARFASVTPREVNETFDRFASFVTPFFTWAVFGAINQFSDRWIIGYGMGDAEVGFYYAIYQIANAPVLFLSSVINQFVVPIIYEQAGALKRPEQTVISDRTLGRALSASLLALAVVLGLASLFAKDIVGLLTTEAFAARSGLLTSLMLGLSIFQLAQLLTIRGLKANKAAIYIWPKGIQAATFVLLGLALMPGYGISGVAMALFLSCFIYLGMVVLANRGIDAETRYTEVDDSERRSASLPLRYQAGGPIVAPLGLMICYARSGGTVLNKCLGVHPNVFVASEVNPSVEYLAPNTDAKMGRLTIKSQARQWMGLDLKGRTFPDKISELWSECSQRGIHLVVRDWSYVNFEAHSPSMPEPSGRLEIIDTLASLKNDIRPFALVRDAIDVWISRGLPNEADFFAAYRRYIDQLLRHSIPVYRYEDFCADPVATVMHICRYLEIPFDETFVHRYQDYGLVFGDDQVLGGSRGRNQREIRPLARRRIPRERWQAVQRNSDFQFVQKQMGYPSTYEHGPVETRWADALHTVKRAINILARGS